MADVSPERDEPDAKADPLRLVLHTMEEQLDDRVDKVSEQGPSRDESTSDLIRLEETLSSAQDKAKQLVTLRLKLDEEQSESSRTDEERSRSAPPAPEPSTGTPAPPHPTASG